MASEAFTSQAYGIVADMKAVADQVTPGLEVDERRAKLAVFTEGWSPDGTIVKARQARAQALRHP